MNYIIFGGTGFIGTHLAKHIKAHNPDAVIWNFDIVEPGQPLPSVKDYKPVLAEGESHPAIFVRADVRNEILPPFQPTPQDIIFNIAAVHRTPGHPDREYFDTNINGAENVTAFADKYGINTIVFTSSISPYGTSEEIKEESTLPQPNTPYGISKLVAEKIHLVWANASKDRKLLIIRAGVVFGKGENGNFSRLYSSIKAGKFAYPGRKDTVKACMYVKELVEFMLWHIDNVPKHTDLINCTFEPAFTIQQIVETMKSVTNIKRTILLIPVAILMPLAYCAKLIGSPMGICPERVRKLMVSTNISGKKLSQSGYKFKYTFAEVLADWLNDCQGKGLM